MRPVSKPTIVQYNQDDYDVLRTFLFIALGGYCSYCEAPISNDSAVEHKVPKNGGTGFPICATQWRNLLIACQSCNSAKGQKPSRADAYNPGNQESFYLNTLNLWVWPDKTGQMPQQASPAVDESLRLFKFEYSEQSQVQLGGRGLVRPSSIQPTLSWANERHKMVWVIPNEAFIGANAALRTRVLTTIQGLNLNYYNSSDTTFNDRRVLNRTMAADRAGKALANLQSVVTKANNNLYHDAVLLMIKAIRQTIIATGFWSVWFGIFRGALSNQDPSACWNQFDLHHRKRLFETLLVYYHERGVPDLIFAGTDYDRLDMGNFT